MDYRTRRIVDVTVACVFFGLGLALAALVVNDILNNL